MFLSNCPQAQDETLVVPHLQGREALFSPFQYQANLVQGVRIWFGHSQELLGDRFPPRILQETTERALSPCTLSTHNAS